MPKTAEQGAASAREREPAADGAARLQPRHLVQGAAAKLRDIILAREPDTCIGSLHEVAQQLGVGVVTVQQAARVLEHEGLLEVRRGPGGGYYGKRPDEAALERSVAAYMQVHPAAFKEVSEIVSLLDTELIPAAARCGDEALREALRALMERTEHADTPDERIAIEDDLRLVLFKMVDRPLIELLTRVARRLQQHRQSGPLLFQGEEGVAAWKAHRRQILQAVLDQDEELARFEANRYRTSLMTRLRRQRGETPAAL
jgi:DNA-binding FadR family transcriptional regulator